MTGIIWIVQLVHYPSFRFADESKFGEFTAFHAKQISKIVMPIMVTEALTGVLLAVQSEGTLFWVLNLGGIIGIWVATFLLSVPSHKKLQQSRSDEEIGRLVGTNWIRTILWSVRSLALLIGL